MKTMPRRGCRLGWAGPSSGLPVCLRFEVVFLYLAASSSSSWHSLGGLVVMLHARSFLMA